MKVGIVTNPINKGDAVRGIGVNTKELINALNDVSGKENFNVVVVNSSDSNLDQYDILHYPVFRPFFISLPFNKPSKKVVLTIHDLIPLIYPKHYVPGLKGNIKFLINKFLIKKNVDAVITISETSKKDIVRFLKIDPEKVFVSYLAPQTANRNTTQESMNNAKDKYKLPNKFVLYVGDVNYNKNIPNLIKACRLASMPLVMVGKSAVDIEGLVDEVKMIRGPKDWIRFLLGKTHPEIKHYKSIITELDKSDNVIRLGYVLPEDFYSVVKQTSLVCLPSFYEGFGLSTLEAFSVEVPVVASRSQAIVEVGEDACIYVDPHNYKDIAEKIKLVTVDKQLRLKLIQKGKERLKYFSWQKTADNILKIYKDLLK